MAILGIPGTENIKLPSMGGSFFSGVMWLILIFVVFLVIGGMFYYWYYLKKQKKLYKHKIFWFEEVHGCMVPIENNQARELTIPGTHINIFYIKEKDMYLPRPVKRMGKDNYWYAIRNNREIVNFTMKNINDEMKQAKLEFDHTDMRYALTNLLALIKRNYRDKSQVWWREYKDVIVLVVYIFVLTLSFIFIVSKVGTLIDKVGNLIEHAEQLIKVAEAKSGSGVMVQ